MHTSDATADNSAEHKAALIIIVKALPFIIESCSQGNLVAWVSRLAASFIPEAADGVTSASD